VTCGTWQRVVIAIVIGSATNAAPPTSPNAARVRITTITNPSGDLGWVQHRATPCIDVFARSSDLLAVNGYKEKQIAEIEGTAASRSHRLIV
jgi:hypothetical protein